MIPIFSVESDLSTSDVIDWILYFNECCQNRPQYFCSFQKLRQVKNFMYVCTPNFKIKKLT